MLKRLASAALVAAFAQGGSLAATGDAARADATRKTPLQRCDQLQDKAEIECLKKARERIVEARKQRESSTKSDPKAVAKK